MRSAASEQDLHCLPMSLLRDVGLKWVKNWEVFTALVSKAGAPKGLVSTRTSVNIYVSSSDYLFFSGL